MRTSATAPAPGHMSVGADRRAGRLVARLAALLLVVPLALAGLTLGASPAFACSCANLTFKQQVAQADTIFLGRVRETTQGDDSSLRILALVQRIYKGELDQPLVEVETADSSAACGIGQLPPGERYLFLTTNGIATICGGTQPANSEVVNRAQRQLGLGTVVQPPRSEATFTPTGEADPPELNRLVAPGAAAVLVGVLGLLVVRRREH